MPSPVPSPLPTLPLPAPTPNPIITSTQIAVSGPALPAWTTPVPTVAVQPGSLHILLIGADGTPYVKHQNTDVLIVAVVDRASKQVSMLSIPRDLWVYIPTYGWDRINTAHKIGYQRDYPGGGPGLLIDTVQHNLGIPIDHWVRVDFDGFAQAVDGLGGVEMVVACPVNLRYQPPTSDTEEEMWLAPGVYHMDGAMALRYVRTRRGGDDFQRSPRQQQFLKAVWDQVRGPGLVAKIPGLWSAMKDSFHTDLTLGEVLSLAPLALELRPERIRSLYIGARQLEGWTTAAGARVQLPRHDKIQQQVASLYAPPASQSEQGADQKVRIMVLNGTSRPDLDVIAADQLRWHGLEVTGTGSAQERDHPQTQIIVYQDRPQALETLVALLQVKPTNIIREPPPGQGNTEVQADILIILGEDYDPCR